MSDNRSIMIIFLAAGFGLAGLSTTAQARPSGYTSAACDPDGTPVCHFNVAGDRWTCTLDDIGETGDVQAWMIYGETDAYSTDCGNICDGNPVCAFGVQNGVKFYCDVDEPDHLDMEEGWLVGTDNKDQLSFWYEEGTDVCYLTNGYSTATMPKLTGKAVGNAGDDTIYGSLESAEAKETDDLNGDADDDHIYAQAGDDVCRGGSGNDVIHTGDGDDQAYGDDGADEINGGDGTDVLFGGAHVDLICGGPGDDDEMYGNGANDELYDDDSESGTADGAAGSDTCDAATVVDCESDFGGTPPTCPSEMYLYP